MSGEGRLVRDGMGPAIGRGVAYTRPVADEAELVRLLRKKLLEGAGEVLEASTPGELREELGDLLQVIIDWANVTVGVESVQAARIAKLHEKGGFEQGTVLAWRQPDD